MVESVVGIIPDIQNIGQAMELSEKYGTVFEYNDFMLPGQLDDAGECRRKTDFYRSLDRDRSGDTLHGAFLDITVHSDDPLIREASKKRIYPSMRVAEELGIRGVVFHTGLVANFYVPYYRRGWLDRNIAFWTETLEDFPGQEIYIENMFDQEADSLAELGKAMAGHGRFGVCLDYGHACAFGGADSIGRWMEELAPYIRHMHINDNDLKDDLHLPVGDGAIDWQQFGCLRRKYQIQSSVLLEVGGYAAQKRSLEYIRENHIL